ncbi:MAG: TRAP transporter small permease [Alphaproteobacteria bacterium]|nr:TRAP transporter small permease [Alphaproteobacteria bacterium]
MSLASGGAGGREPALSFGGLLAGLNALGTVLILFLMALINLDVGLRYFFNSPIRGVPELVGLSIVAIVFLQLAHALRLGKFTRSDVLLGPLLRDRPRIGHGLQMLYHLTGAVLLGIMLWALVPLLVEAWVEDLYVGAKGDFTAPEWPVKLVLVVGSAACAIQFLLLAWQDWQRVRAR